MTESHSITVEKTTSLATLHPAIIAFRQRRVSLIRVQGVLNIVLGLEPNPLSEQSIPNSEKASENGVASSVTQITSAQRKAIAKWKA